MPISTTADTPTPTRSMTPPMVARSPDRDFLITPTEHRNHGSPTSVVLNENHHQNHRNMIPGLPSVEEIQLELQKLDKRSSNSKATFRHKLTKATNELRDSTTQVELIGQQLVKAIKKRDRHSEELQRAKLTREMETEKLTIRKLHLDILQFCLNEEEEEEDTNNNDNEYDVCDENFNDKNNKSNKSNNSSNRIMEVLGACQQDGCGLFHIHKDNDTLQELKETRHRLEEINYMFEESQTKYETACGENKLIAREDAIKMKSTAIELFLAFKKNKNSNKNTNSRHR